MRRKKTKDVEIRAGEHSMNLDLDDEFIQDPDVENVGSVAVTDRWSQGVLAVDRQYLLQHKRICGDYSGIIPDPRDTATADTLWITMQQEHEDRRVLTPYEALAAKEEPREGPSDEAQ